LPTGHVLRFQFKSRKLAALYVEEKDAHKYPPAVVDAFFDVVGIIDAALDERDLYALKGLRCEKLKGAREHQHSVRLNKQHRLILELENDNQGRYIRIIDIEDYH
jgi:proteic killer suppression protein